MCDEEEGAPLISGVRSYV